ncbi:MAG: hypothetical protein GX573_06905 [Chloroflexi bacterium]|nr:hypothetical protein [Chloroflexota bacterium]
MGPFLTALTRLAAVPVSGVTSYPLDSMPDALTPAQLPALVIVPELGGASPGLEPSIFAAGEGMLVARVAHLLIVAPVAGGLGARGAFPALAAAIDDYLAAMASDPLLDGALRAALHVDLRAGVVRYAGVEFHGATFTHTWRLRVE